MPRREVVDLVDQDDELGVGLQQCTCANPRCDEQYVRTPGPGRRKEFHNDECRRSAERDLRRIQARLDHYSRQAEQMQARAAAYLRTSLEDPTETAKPGPTVQQRRAAREAVAEIRGMSRFLENHQGEFAGDLLKLFRAVEPILG